MNTKTVALIFAAALITAQTQGQAPSQAKNKTAIIGVAAPIASLDPFSLTGIESYSSTGYALEALTKPNPLNGQLTPRLALSWAMNPDKKTFQVKLRDKVTFHNGQKLTADDVKFTFDAYHDPDYKGQVWQGMWAGVIEAKVIDPQTVEFKMKEWRYEGFLAVMTAMRIMPKSFYAPADPEKFRKEIVGTGSFKFKRFEANGNLELEPNQTWWDQPKPKHNVIVKRVPSAKLAAEMINKRQLDFYAPDAGEASTLSPKGYSLQKLRSGLGNGFNLELNMREQIFKNPKVRQALLLLWQRENLNRQVFKNQLKLALDIFSPNTENYPEAKPVNADLKKAQSLLKEDGWADQDKDQVLEKLIDGKVKQLSFSVLVTSSDEERWVTLYQRDAAKAGIKVSVERAEPDNQLYNRLMEGNYQARANGGGLQDEATRLAWHSKGPYNFGKYANAEVDQKIEELEKEFEPRKRRLITRQIIQMIREDLPVIPGLYSPDQFFMTSSGLKIDSTQPSNPAKWQLR